MADNDDYDDISPEEMDAIDAEVIEVDPPGETAWRLG